MDIAVVGFGCNFPLAPSPELFWQLLLEGKSAISDCADRAFFKGLPDHLRRGGYIDHNQYDTEKFNITPREARHIDPQQKLILEVMSQMLDQSHISTSQLSKAKTGIFIGVMGSDWGRLTLSDLNTIDIHTGTGNGYCMIPNRISYLYNLKGPSIAIDTACSSSLVAVDIAYKYLSLNEIDIAIVGGVNAILTPALNIFYQKAGLASKTGACKSFGSHADGIVRGEGGGLVILKRLDDALSDKNPIYALIKATAVNHDGKSNGLTAPNKWAQIDVIRTALEKGNLLPETIDYVEAHGTGTTLGDPIEAQALSESLAKHRHKSLSIGSVKSNIGHLEGAAGIASLIKVILSMQYNKIPASLHYGNGNSLVDFDKLNISVVTQTKDWITPSKYAGVSSFGLGGTNAHIILSNYENNVDSNSIIYLKNQFHSLDLDLKAGNNDFGRNQANRSQKVFSILIELISKVTERSSHQIKDSSELISQLGMDSLMMAELKEKIESSFEFNKEMEFAEILKLSTVSDLYHYVLSIIK